MVMQSEERFGESLYKGSPSDSANRFTSGAGAIQRIALQSEY